MMDLVLESKVGSKDGDDRVPERLPELEIGEASFSVISEQHT